MMKPYESLAVAIIELAIRDARRSNKEIETEAREWLQSDHCLIYMELLNIDHLHPIIVRWVEQGCPGMKEGAELKLEGLI